MNLTDNMHSAYQGQKGRIGSNGNMPDCSVGDHRIDPNLGSCMFTVKASVYTASGCIPLLQCLG